ncbi:MAG: Mov34/MPN/PAD-1 family protein [Candidatus Woesearchaeota archaeon]
MDVASHLEEKKRIGEIKEYLKSARITHEAFKKMNIYHDIIKDIMGSPHEVAGFLLTNPNREDNIAQEIFLIRDQEIEMLAGGNHNLATNYPLIREQGMNVLGLWHTHGSADVFHSNQDMANLRDIFNGNRHSLPNYLSVGEYQNFFSKDDFTIKREDNNMIIEKNIDSYTKAGELMQSIPSRIRLELKEDAEEEIAGMLEEYIMESVGGINFPLEKGLCYINSVVTNEQTARLAASMDQHPDINPRCSLRTLVQEAPFSDAYIELGDEQLQLELIDETNNITLDEKVLRDEVYDCVQVGGVPIGDYAARKKSRIFDFGNKEEPQAEEESLAERIAEQRSAHDSDEEAEEASFAHELNMKGMEAYNFLPKYHRDTANQISRAEEVIQEGKSYEDFLPVLMSGLYEAKKLLKNAYDEGNNLENVTGEYFNEAVEHLKSVKENIQNAYKNGRERKFSKKETSISPEGMQKLKDPGGGYNPQKPSDPPPQEVGKKNNPSYDRE